jgi:CDP-glucose 4,6-dehydratase
MEYKSSAVEDLVDVMPEKLKANIWEGQRVLLTGHTGFKGAWMALLLKRLGVKVFGLAMKPNTTPNLSDILPAWEGCLNIPCDIRDQSSLDEALSYSRPEIVIHMAAQALVKESYKDPIGTIQSNVMGTINLLESLRSIDELKTVLIITSDKVYKNTEEKISYDENSPLGGYDPYSASKAATEILTASYRDSFYREKNIPVITARAGNVIGGGDWAKDRLVPDLWRAYEANRPVVLRNPSSIRPWQHVLDPIYGYLLYIQKSILSPENCPLSLNFGPPREPVQTVKEVSEKLLITLGADKSWLEETKVLHVHENKFLSIDSSLSLRKLGWKTMLPIEDAVLWTGQWYKAYRDKDDLLAFTENQINAYAKLIKEPLLLR